MGRRVPSEVSLDLARVCLVKKMHSVGVLVAARYNLGMWMFSRNLGSTGIEIK